jgi:hypothetical protein
VSCAISFVGVVAETTAFGTSRTLRTSAQLGRFVGYSGRSLTRSPTFLFGTAEFYGWSEDKVRQCAGPERADWGAFVRGKEFRLD